MAALLLDTHVWAWTLADAPLPPPLFSALAEAEVVYISPISLYEIGQKVRLGKWPEMLPFVPRLAEVLREQNGFVAELTPEICLKAATLDWDHRDPFDRFIAATALANGWPLASVDPAFDTCPGGIRRIS